MNPQDPAHESHGATMKERVSLQIFHDNNLADPLVQGRASHVSTCMHADRQGTADNSHGLSDPDDVENDQAGEALMRREPPNPAPGGRLLRPRNRPQVIRAARAECSRGRTDPPTKPSLAIALQCVEKHRLVEDGSRRRFELFCLLQNGKHRWIEEATVQRASNAAVCTYWGCGPDGRQRPEPESRGGVPPQPLRILSYKYFEGSPLGKLLVQMVGCEAGRAEWRFASEVKEKWPEMYEDHRRRNEATPPTLAVMNTADVEAAENEVETILGHRVFEDDDGFKEFQLSCLLRSGDESWQYEVEVQQIYNAAVLTYWASEPEARAGKVPDRYFNILSHHRPHGKLFLRVQWVGSSTHSTETTLRTAANVRDEWPEGYWKYLKTHNLTCDESVDT